MTAIHAPFPSQPRHCEAAGDEWRVYRGITAECARNSEGIQHPRFPRPGKNSPACATLPSERGLFAGLDRGERRRVIGMENALRGPDAAGGICEPRKIAKLFKIHSRRSLRLHPTR